MRKYDQHLFASLAAVFALLAVWCVYFDDTFAGIFACSGISGCVLAVAAAYIRDDVE